MSYEDTKHLRIFWGAMLSLSVVQGMYLAHLAGWI